MKSKKLTYFLLVIVIIVWGAVFKQFFFAFNQNEVTNIPTTFVKKIDNTLTIKDTFSITANYQDPFLKNHKYSNQKKRVTSVKRKQRKAPIKQKTVQPTVQKIDWSFIKYNGVFNSRKMVINVAIHNQTHIMIKGDSTNGVAILSVKKDSIEVKYKKQQTWIQRQ